MAQALISGEAIDAPAELARFLAALTVEGAVASFAGIARPKASDGSAVHRLFLDHHPALSPRSVEEIATAAQDRFAVTAVRAIHRFGEVAPGDTIVFVAASAPHRRAALEAVDYIMDRLKTEAMFWKREDTAAGNRWIEPTAADHAAHARWSGDAD